MLPWPSKPRRGSSASRLTRRKWPRSLRQHSKQWNVRWQAVGQHARHLLQILDGKTGAFRRESLETFITRRADIPDSSRALGWDTMLASSSCGSLMSPHAFGHTGFTGTSLWIDPDRGVYVVLLTNRVHPSRANEAIKQVRPALHDAVIAALDP